MLCYVMLCYIMLCTTQSIIRPELLARPNVRIYIYIYIYIYMYNMRFHMIPDESEIATSRPNVRIQRININTMYNRTSSSIYVIIIDRP
eukprot:COSAG06_NODE_8240_length_2226_cov_16.176305_2_plen_89_part_00